jgi:glycosyltransferase involved in cell wall biosynthesis
MKIVVVGSRGFPGVQGGVEKHCEKLYTHLAEKGCDITVFTRKPYVDPDLHTYKGVSLISINCPKSKYLEAFVHTFRSLLQAIKLKPDILHLHAIGPSMFAFFARTMGWKVVVTNHGPDYERKKWSQPAKIFLKVCELMGVKFANKVIAIAKSISHDLKLKYGISAAVIPNGVEIPKLADTFDMLKKLGIEKERYILSVGRLVPEKGFDDLIDAFKKLQNTSCKSQVKSVKSQIKDWKLVIVGRADHEDKYSSDLKMQADRNSNIILTGFLSGLTLHELYSHAGLFILPSYYEGLPIALLEAMSYGLSCIASNIPANRNVELSNDRFFNVGDVEDITLKIKQFIDRPFREKEKKRQISILTENYNWKKIADETMKVYKHVLS